MKKKSKSKHKKRSAQKDQLLQIAEQLLHNYFDEEMMQPIDRWLSGEMRGKKLFKSLDSAALTGILFSAVRFGYFTGFLKSLDMDEYRDRAISNATAEYAEKSSDSTSIFTIWKTMHPAMFLAITQRRQEQSADSVLRWPAGLKNSSRINRLFDSFQKFRKEEPGLKIDLLWYSIPLFLEPCLTRRIQLSNWSEQEVQTFLARTETRPPLWIRFNTAASLELVSKDFTANSLRLTEDSNAYRVRGHKGLYELDSFKNGLFEIQDLASQAIAETIDVKPGEYVWDCCAGRGGKTFHIASRMNNKGAVHSSDIRENKLKNLKKRAGKAGFDNVRTFPWDGESSPKLPFEVQKTDGFHWVLVDTPCSASGTWRRNPDAKYRITEETIKELNELQLRLLKNASGAVRPGGKLVYATCSWMVEENEDIAEQFLEETEGFSLVEQKLHGNPELDSDTTFTAVFRKEDKK